MSKSLLTVSKEILYYTTVILVIVFVQFVFLNIMPNTINEVDVFLIVSAIYILRKDYKIAFPFLFFAMFIDEIVFPIAKIIGVKALSALLISYIFYLIFKKMVLKGWLFCLTVAIYSLFVFILTKIFLAFLNYSDLIFNYLNYIFLFVNTFLFTCVLRKKINVE